MGRDLALKFFSLILALILWLVVLMKEGKISQFPGSLPVQIRNTPAGFAAIYDPQKIKVKIHAPPDALVRLGMDNFNVYADLAGLDEGTHEVDIKATTNLSNVTVVEKTPSTMLVRLEPVVTKNIPIKVVLKGQVKSSFAALPKVNPDKVLVKGAKSLIDDISQLEVPIELTGENRDFSKRVPLKKQTGIEFTPQNVDILVSIVPSSGTKTVGVKVRTRGQPKANYYVSSIECLPAVVEIFSFTDSLQSVTYIETKEIDIEGLEENLEKEVALSAPAGISLKEKKVRVKITLASNTVERQITASYRYNLSPNFRVISTEPVRVVVSGPAKIINNLTSAKVVICFDLTKKEPGKYLVNIERSMISVPKECTAVSFLPSTVTIVLEEY
jgi:YbbR domain-containing protein